MRLVCGVAADEILGDGAGILAAGGIEVCIHQLRLRLTQPITESRFYCDPGELCERRNVGRTRDECLQRFTGACGLALQERGVSNRIHARERRFDFRLLHQRIGETCDLGLAVRRKREDP
jgi:hypothetical protein